MSNHHLTLALGMLLVWSHLYRPGWEWSTHWSSSIVYLDNNCLVLGLIVLEYTDAWLFLDLYMFYFGFDKIWVFTERMVFGHLLILCVVDWMFQVRPLIKLVVARLSHEWLHSNSAVHIWEILDRLGPKDTFNSLSIMDGMLSRIAQSFCAYQGRTLIVLAQNSALGWNWVQCRSSVTLLVEKNSSLHAIGGVPWPIILLNHQIVFLVKYGLVPGRWNLLLLLHLSVNFLL
jgi:hypothetical protein